ncbi:hypothetical protein ACWGH8_42480 [Nonomuraea muscovyensis]|jgi:hypothetical protein|uniref:Dodecin domain-containing protein n=1 Tax=Nonomuraea muscovyensis TaxID=1124761 RepID=A0A7X0F0R4_9ACTN|nr:hypothetical protein [Nonomuraea muscovyensis]MBB6351572.1 hypothetical protein [Nonomuraea muscovyensis]
MRPVPFELHVTVTGDSPHEIERAAYPVAQRFYGGDAEIDVLSAKAEPDPGAPGTFRATIVFRRIATHSE